MVHVCSGTGAFGPQGVAAKAEQCVFFKPQKQGQAQQGGSGGGSVVKFSCPAGAAEPLDVLLLAGLPTGEPVVQHGPFVGSTQVRGQGAGGCAVRGGVCACVWRGGPGGRGGEATYRHATVGRTSRRYRWGDRGAVGAFGRHHT